MNVLTCWLLVCTSLLGSYRASAQKRFLPDSLTHAPDSTRAWTLRQIGDSLVRVSQLAPAKQAYLEALDVSLAAKEPDPGTIGLSYRGVGYWYEQANELREAIQYYQKALGYLRQYGNTFHVARTLKFISGAYTRLNDLKMARHYLNQAVTVAQQSRNIDLLMELDGELAIVEAKSNRHDRALVLNQKIADYYRQKEDWSTYYGVLINVALTYKNLGQYAQSEVIFRSILDYSKQANDAFLEGYAHTNIPNALIPQGKLDEAEAHCKQALIWAEQTGAGKYSILEDIYGNLSKTYQKRGNYRQALAYYEQRTAAHDSVFNEIRNRQLAEVEARFQTQEKEAQIQVLDAINAAKTRQVWAGAIGILVLSILSGTLFVFYRRIRRNRAQIQQQSEQLTLMMKELHHRVKNNLAIVSSLLRLQSNRLDDEKAIAAVRVGQQRVEAMSMIHQRLYQTDRVSTVNMSEFLTDLSESLMRAYGFAPDDFDLQLDIELNELDVDVAMPLGLIVNELVTNAFKYAYADVQRPKLRISLHRQNGLAQPGLTLEVQDNGPGLDTADWQRDGHRTSFGKRLIYSLSEQLDGQLELIRQNGTLCRLYIPQTKLRAAA
ncbi:histidine kinase dimerization/phosphoacceptor domain -containing protein [Spirosoma sp. 209]|uniref:histidine kinase dimerization/phosphoacceptor domain -containing protein n=1 Tax=Spirosoma sp. 209 TaxID=1955701 RepID=UPI00098D7339|nr:histidine kinase dimerization/phosphoacceptor domain -containing protein [Spirosoma sp. 209]